MNKSYNIKEVSRIEYSDYILNIHYAKRFPSISYAFGLFEEGSLVGVVTYGTPPSPSLRIGVAGKEHAKDVLELNRLCLKNNKVNEASMLVGRSLKLLPKGKIIISFADTEQNHIGYVYQATNFKYTGLSAKRTDWKIKGKEHLHGISVADEFRGQENRSILLREKYGEDFYLKDRPRKHRYVFITGKKKINLKYKCYKYPKG